MAKILIIDDEQPIREALGAIAAAAGHECCCAADGRQGLAQFALFQPDLVITDLLMPDIEGMETIGEMRRLRPDLPIIAVSGGGRVGNMTFLKIAESLGANRSIAKPFSAAAIMTAFAELLPAGGAKG